jgi:hypothetical protein
VALIGVDHLEENGIVGGACNRANILFPSGGVKKELFTKERRGLLIGSGRIPEPSMPRN